MQHRSPKSRTNASAPPLRLLAWAVAIAAFQACRPAVDPPDPGPPMRLELRTAPGDAQAGVPLGTQPVIAVVDREGMVLADLADFAVVAEVESGQAQIAAGGTANVVGGIATFTNLTLLGQASREVNLRFVLSDNGQRLEESDVSADAFTLSAGPPAIVQATPTATIAGTPGQRVMPVPSVTVFDAAQNPLRDVPVAFAVTGGGGVVEVGAQTTSATGVASPQAWILGLPGQNTLTATVTPTLSTTFNANVTATTGHLRVLLDGNPTGVAALVRLLKTGGAGAVYDETVQVQDSLTITDLPFGTYQVTGDSVNSGPRIWLAMNSFTGLNVATNSGPAVTLNYVEHGRFEITTRGLPQPDLPATLDFLPAGPTGEAFAVTVRNDAVTRGLAPVGSYNVAPRTTVVGGQVYAPAPAQQPATFAGGADVVQMTVNYVVTTGILSVTIAGDSLPAGLAPLIDISGPGGFRETVFMSGTRTWPGLVPGTYTVTAAPVVVEGVTWTPAPTSVQAVIAAGETEAVEFSYAKLES